VTEPGPLERLPTKVVPYVVTGYAEEEVAQEPPVDELPPEPEERPVRRRGPLLGLIALTLAVLTIVAHVTAVVIASGNDFAPATIVGYVAIGLSAASVLAGAVAVILRLGRPWGVIAIVLGVVANPFVLLVVLRFVGELVAR
jgi:hypothetical protein